MKRRRDGGHLLDIARKWARDKIYRSTLKKLDLLKSADEVYHSNPANIGNPLRTADELRQIKSYTFRLDSNHPKVIQAVTEQIQNLYRSLKNTQFKDVVFGIEKAADAAN